MHLIPAFSSENGPEMITEQESGVDSCRSLHFTLE